jgi:CRP/FNR family transcriptional regulator, cyclic AMP receptor protein
MESFLALAASQPTLTLKAGAVLIAQGQPGGDLYVLETGQLIVERDGVKVATISTPGALVGEMSVLLGTPNTATVRAERETNVRILENAREILENHPKLTLRLAGLMASRLDATSAVLVELSKEHSGDSEQGLLGKIIAALHRTADDSHYVRLSRSDLFQAPDSLQG